VLEYLRRQTLPQDDWELLVIDNRSDPPLASGPHLSWHPHARLVREEKLGLTWARVRGMAEAAGELIVFVDDDNLLAPDYLERALKVFKNRPEIGVWGGEVELQFETPPADWTRSYWWMLGSRTVERDTWSKDSQGGCVPCGAGMCVRKAVADRYASTVAHDPKRQALDRRGADLSSSGDTDLALTACDMGLGLGQSAELKLKHLIPPSRLTPEYILKLQEGMAFSDELLNSIRRPAAVQPPRNWRQRGMEWARYLRLSSFDKKMFSAEKSGRTKARAFVRQTALALH
jgi:hypothetical protein